MAKTKTNNYSQATKEIGSMDKDLTEKIPQEIENKDAKMYHVALVKIAQRPGQVKNDVSVTVQQYHQNGFEKIKRSFIFQGFNKLIVVHDPSAKGSQSEPAKPNKETGTKEPNDPPKKETTNKGAKKDPSASEILEKEYQNAIGGNKPELIDFAEKNGIDLGEATNNDLRAEAITEWFNKKMESQE